MARSNRYRLGAPNAWLSEIKRLAGLLDSVYSQSVGEVWLFDNDLKVLEDADGAFDALYAERIDGSLAAHVSCVLILLSDERFDRFCDPARSPQLFKNLCKLRADRLRTFYVGRLEKVSPRPSKRLGGHHPWVFYLGEELMASREGIIIVRPNTYPFSHDDKKDNIAVAWRNADSDIDTFRFRLDQGWFNQVFVADRLKNFMSIEPKTNRAGKVLSYDFIPALNKSSLRDISTKLPAKSSLPVVPPVDCGIVTALDVEFKSVISTLGLSRRGTAPYATGWLQSSAGALSVVAAKCDEPGSVHACNTGSLLIRDWRPKALILVGICGACRASDRSNSRRRRESDLAEGDVVVADNICAYEYQSWGVDKKGKEEVEYDTRDVVVTPRLVSAAKSLVAKPWVMSNAGRRCKAIAGGYACGCKLIRRGSKWFESVRSAAGKRKIVAVEMEAEGVGLAAKIAGVDFLMIKGISDFANKRKGDADQARAAKSASRFLKDLLGQAEFHAALNRDRS